MKRTLLQAALAAAFCAFGTANAAVTEKPSTLADQQSVAVTIYNENLALIKDVRKLGQPGTPPEVEFLTTGYRYLTEQRYDLIDPVMEILRRDLGALGLPLRSFEVEFGPSEFEVTLSVLTGMAAADVPRSLGLGAARVL